MESHSKTMSSFYPHVFKTTMRIDNDKVKSKQNVDFYLLENKNKSVYSCFCNRIASRRSNNVGCE